VVCVFKWPARISWIIEFALLNEKALSFNFFCNTLPALDRAYLRPRYDG
jgi:hypothetical protein